MKKVLLVFGILLCPILYFCYYLFPLDAQTAAKRQFEAMAKESDYFDWQLSDELLTKDQQIQSRYKTLLKHFESLHTGEENILPLLKHSDPKVRTLAIVYLTTNFDDPQILPAIGNLLEDNSNSFGEFYNDCTIHPEKIDTLEHVTTVGEIASRALYPYVWGNYYNTDVMFGEPIGFQSRMTPEEFAQYWEPRKNRKYCPSWFAVRLEKVIFKYPDADQPGAAWDKYSAPILADIKKQVPPAEQKWVYLWIIGERSLSNLADNFQTSWVQMLHEIGPDELMTVLKNQRIPSDDPDLQKPEFYSHFEEITRIYARQLLRPQDAETLVTIFSNKENKIDEQKWWLIDAADRNRKCWLINAAYLNPKKAPEILRPLYVENSQKGYSGSEVDLALWELEGESQIPFLVEEFYRGSDNLARIDTMGNSASGEKLVLGILQDKRLDSSKVDRWTLASLAGCINRFAGKEIITQAELAYSNEGEDSQGNVRKGERYIPSHPNPENPARRLTLLKKMRDSIPLWTEPKS